MAVQFQGFGASDANIEQTLVERDLVLLRLRRQFSIVGLKATQQIPAPNTTVWVYGYGGGSATRTDRALRVMDANRDSPLLTEAVDAAGRDELQRLRSPQLDTEVLRVDGNLAPGDSGAPLVDSAGRVVAIGSGGLQRGTIGIGWAVRARYLDELAASTGKRLGPGVLAGTSYALADPSVSAAIQCGSVRFNRTRTLPLDTLVRTSDDPAGWQQLAMATGRALASISQLKFDIWTDAHSGAAVALPQGADPEQLADDRCRVPLAGNNVELQFAGNRISGTGSTAWSRVAAVQQLSVTFENSWVAEFWPYVAPNLSFTYPAPHLAGPVTIRRADWFGQRPGESPYNAFETMMAKGDTFIGIVAIDRKWFPWGPQPPDLLDHWIAATFAAHLSTFPP